MDEDNVPSHVAVGVYTSDTTTDTEAPGTLVPLSRE